MVSPVAGPQPTETGTTASASVGAAVAKLSIDDFAIDERTGKVEACPTGRIPLNVVCDPATGTTTIHMAPEDCVACPFREQCPIKPGTPTYKVSYTDKQRRLEGRRREQATAVFRERYAKRSGLESTNSGVKRRLGLGQLRVRGRRAVDQALVTIFAQQCEIVEDRVTVRTKTGGDCVQNPSDLEATYDGKKGQGYQVQFSETCAAGNDVQLIVSA